MKVRDGFVSNSSTSSFVFTGWLLKEDKKHRKEEIIKKIIGIEILDKYCLDYGDQKFDESDEALKREAMGETLYELDREIDVLDHDENGLPSGYALGIGKKWADNDPCDMDETVVSMTEVLKHSVELMEELDLAKSDDFEFAMVAGIRMS